MKAAGFRRRDTWLKDVASDARAVELERLRLGTEAERRLGREGRSKKQVRSVARRANRKSPGAALAKKMCLSNAAGGKRAAKKIHTCEGKIFSQKSLCPTQPDTPPRGTICTAERLAGIGGRQGFPSRCPRPQLRSAGLTATGLWAVRLSRDRLASSRCESKCPLLPVGDFSARGLAPAKCWRRL